MDFKINEQQPDSTYADFITMQAAYKRKARKKAIRIILALGLFAVVLLFVVNKIIKNSDAYATALTYIKANPKIQKETGGVKEFGWMPIGNIHVEGDEGEAQLSISVVGNEKDIDVTVLVIKENDKNWRVTEAYIEE